jgi:hypothetical protein
MPTEPERLRQEWLGKNIHVTTVDGKTLEGTFKGIDPQSFVLETKGGLMIVFLSALVAMKLATTPPQEYNARAGENPKP